MKVVNGRERNAKKNSEKRVVDTVRFHFFVPKVGCDLGYSYDHHTTYLGVKYWTEMKFFPLAFFHYHWFFYLFFFVATVHNDKKKKSKRKSAQLRPEFIFYAETSCVLIV